MDLNNEIKALGNMLAATDEWDAGRLRAIAERANYFANRATNNVIRSAANRLETINETVPGLQLGEQIESLRHAIGEGEGQRKEGA